MSTSDNEKRLENLEKSMSGVNESLSKISGALEMLLSKQQAPPTDRVVTERRVFYFNKDQKFEDTTQVENISIYAISGPAIKDKTKEDIAKENGLVEAQAVDDFIELHTTYIAVMKYDGKMYESSVMDKKSLNFFKSSFEQWMKKKIF